MAGVLSKAPARLLAAVNQSTNTSSTEESEIPGSSAHILKNYFKVARPERAGRNDAKIDNDYNKDQAFSYRRDDKIRANPGSMQARTGRRPEFKPQLPLPF
ncbi:hypothetical protein TWF751_001939 [Orbilia oligospora]|nr:hypothetical protein TWF751_001939 [Orbilia oligospora]